VIPRRRSAASGLLLATSLIALACDARTTEEPDVPSPREAEPGLEAEATTPEAATSVPPRDLDQLERELAANEEKLRQLGVAIVATGSFADGEGSPTDTPAKDVDEVRPDSPTPDPKPTQAPDGSSRTPDRKTGKAGGSKPNSKKEDKSKTATIPGGAGATGTKLIGELDDGDATPEPAKSIQAPPTTEKPTEQAEDRCPLICSLADSTCGLTDEICELAERHPDDDAYSIACERASGDCSLAREACLECVD
jgi:hypothetical protein